jgi:hypothetical protein
MLSKVWDLKARRERVARQPSWERRRSGREGAAAGEAGLHFLLWRKQASGEVGGGGGGANAAAAAAVNARESGA